MTIQEPRLNKGKLIHTVPSANAKENYGRESPTFCLRYVDPKCCITNCDKNDKAAFAERIRKLSTMTWNDIIQADKHGFGREQIPQDKIRAKMPSHITKDMTLIALRFSGKKPMVGYQHKAMFHILWFDRDFKLYNHG